MINDQEFLQGAAFLRLINFGQKTIITHASLIHPSIYLVETDSSKSAVLFKLSKKPKSAWSFTLSSQEELALDVLYRKYPKFSVFLALICHNDGVCASLERGFGAFWIGILALMVGIYQCLERHTEVIM